MRGRAGDLLTPELALALGRGGAAVARADAPRLLIVRDTRESGHMLEAALAAGAAAAGGDALLGGVLPTPGAALLVRRFGLDLAAVVSASHNPYPDNGIKFFGPDGTKLSDEDERRIEALVAASRDQRRGTAEGAGAPAETSGPASTGPGRVHELHGAGADYLRELELRFQALDLRGTRVLIDCANGATHRVAPEIFRRLGADVEAMGCVPDGRNINHGCGSTYLDPLARRMADEDFHAGFAFDGDGDRVLAVDRHGVVVDGDELIALAAMHLRRAGRLRGDGVAVTVMTNYGFHQAMDVAGIRVATTPVGDRNVLAELLARGWALGGEQSGHIIDTGFVPSGDGIAAALLALEALAGRDLADRDAGPPSCPSGWRTSSCPTAARRWTRRRPASGRPSEREDARGWRGPRASPRPTARGPSRWSGSWSKLPTRRSASRCSPGWSSSPAPRSPDHQRFSRRPPGTTDAAIGRILVRLPRPGIRRTPCHVRHRRLRGREALSRSADQPASRSSSTADTTPPASPCSPTGGSTRCRAVGNLSNATRRARGQPLAR